MHMEASTAYKTMQRRNVQKLDYVLLLDSCGWVTKNRSQTYGAYHIDCDQCMLLLVQMAAEMLMPDGRSFTGMKKQMIKELSEGRGTCLNRERCTFLWVVEWHCIMGNVRELSWMRDAVISIKGSWYCSMIVFVKSGWSNMGVEV